MQGAEVRQGDLDCRRVGHIQLGMPNVTQLTGQLSQRLVVDIQQPNLPAVLMKQPGGGGADP